MRPIMVVVLLVSTCIWMAANVESQYLQRVPSFRSSAYMQLEPSIPPHYMARAGEPVSPRWFFNSIPNIFGPVTKTKLRNKKVRVTCTVRARRPCEDDERPFMYGKRTARNKRTADDGEQFPVAPSPVLQMEMTMAPAQRDLGRQERDADSNRFELPSTIGEVLYTQPLPFGLSARQNSLNWNVFRRTKTVTRTRIILRTRSLLPYCSAPTKYRRCARRPGSSQNFFDDDNGDDDDDDPQDSDDDNPQDVDDDRPNHGHHHHQLNHHNHHHSPHVADDDFDDSVDQDALLEDDFAGDLDEEVPDDISSQENLDDAKKIAKAKPTPGDNLSNPNNGVKKVVAVESAVDNDKDKLELNDELANDSGSKRQAGLSNIEDPK